MRRRHDTQHRLRSHDRLRSRGGGSREGQTAGSEAGAAPSAAEANNPLAKFQAFNVHDYYVPALSELDDQNANTFWFRYAQPFGKWLFRASLPVSRVADGRQARPLGAGGLNAFAAYQFDIGEPEVSFGVGPQIAAPTASEDETGTGRWQGGLAAISSTPGRRRCSGAGSSPGRRTSPATRTGPERTSSRCSPSTSSSSARGCT